jgi:gliding motility-associated-like protein
VFDDIDSNSEISYIGAGTSFDWYKYSNTSVSISNQYYFSPETNSGGYLLRVDGASELISVWVINYSEFLPQIDAVNVAPDLSNCATTRLDIVGTIPVLYYQSPNGAQYSIERNATITYNTQHWAETAWQTADTTIIASFSGIYIDVPAPLCNTTFSVKIEDRFSSDMQIIVPEVESAMYAAVAVKNKIVTITSSREDENEDQRPDNETFLEGSAPLNILFKGNPTEGVTFNQWTVFRENQFLFTRSEAEHRFVFSDFGHYKIVLVSSNATCSYSDSLIVQINESLLQIPNVFTPNGDGIHDEFRVAFRSLKTFQMQVYNRWGNKVYESTNPQKGWDGYIGNKKAVSGAYFYVIKAEGTDGKKYYRRGDINLIR